MGENSEFGERGGNVYPPKNPTMAMADTADEQVSKKWRKQVGCASYPFISLGTWKSPKGQAGAAVKAAIAAGYKGIDCANDYGNEKEIGVALKVILCTSGQTNS